MRGDDYIGGHVIKLGPAEADCDTPAIDPRLYQLVVAISWRVPTIELKRRFAHSRRGEKFPEDGENR